MNKAGKYKYPWIYSPSFDGLYILAPGFLALFITIILPEKYKTTNAMPLMGWVVLVLLVDVAHVYSTLFRTYWNKNNFTKHRSLYIAVPVVCYIISVLLYALGDMIFWRVLAYLAVFHFIRQQYGIMRLYTRKEPRNNLSAHLDTITIYAATLYPVIYWHCTPDRNFNWFIDGDFLIADAAIVQKAILYVYITLLAAYWIKEIFFFVKSKLFNLPKNLVIVGTALTWYFGIVYFNGDLAFTMLNVVSHGIPYMALIWAFERKGKAEQPSPVKRSLLPQLVLFLSAIFFLAYFEEGLWDALIWREHESVFGIFSKLPSVTGKEILALLIPLLSLPQATHYVLDGFIWRRTK